MAEKKRSNTVKIVGYLKENNLEQVKNSRGDSVIRGSLIIATSKTSNHKVQFYVAETTFNGEKSKDFENLSALLPNNTITIASYLKENAEATYETAISVASRVWMMGRFEEYATRSGERVSSYITIKGFRAGFSKSEGNNFTTCAEFETDVYLNKIEPELDENDTATGRLLIEGLIPKYDGSIDVIDYVAVTENGVADYIKNNYHEGETTTLKGDIVNLQEKILTDEGESEFFGKASAPQYETKFIRERRITGGSKKTLKDGEDGAITKSFVKDGLAAREVKMEQNGQRAKSSPNKSEATPTTVKSDDLDW